MAPNTSNFAFIMFKTIAIIILNNSNQNENQVLNGDFYSDAIKDPFKFPKKNILKRTLVFLE